MATAFESPESSNREPLREVVDALGELHRRFATELETQDPSWGSESFALGSGVVALHGPGLFVNQACGVGIDAPLRESDLQVLLDRSVAVGVDPAVEVSPLTHPDTLAQLTGHGFVRDGDVEVFLHDLKELPPTSDTSFRIEAADGPSGLAMWQATAALGWGHDTVAARRSSDAYAAAAAVVDVPGLLLAVDPAGDPVGCATVSVIGRVAVLGGMSTVPPARGRGVQASLIRHRLELARQHGAVIAVSTTQHQSPSARNLARHGFSSAGRLVTYLKASR